VRGTRRYTIVPARTFERHLDFQGDRLNHHVIDMVSTLSPGPSDNPAGVVTRDTRVVHTLLDEMTQPSTIAYGPAQRVLDSP
jgi:hypothetical protein